MTYTIVQHADSFDLLRALPSGAFDHAITDPPYDEHCQANQTSGTAYRKMVNGEIASTGIPKIELPFAPLQGYDFISDLVRVSKRWALSFCTVEGFGEMKRAAPAHWVRGGIWYKTNAMGQLTRDRPASCYEGIGILHSEAKKVWNGRGSYGLWPCPGTRGKKGRHPNEKPVNLCLKLVALFTDPGDTVFDPFCGSGAIGEACLLLGRNYFGVDQDPEWVRRASERLAAVPWASVTDEHALSLCQARKADIVAEVFDPAETRTCTCMPATEFEPPSNTYCEIHKGTPYTGYLQ